MKTLKNSRPLSLHIPEPRFRPGETADFSNLNIAEAGATRRPPVDSEPKDMRELAYGLVRVLNKAGEAVGPWKPDIDVETMKRGLRTMMLTRVYDDRMYRAQRQGKTSFYMKCTGEEAVSIAQAMVLNHDDMCFPTYRQQGLLLARDDVPLNLARAVPNAVDARVSPHALQGELAHQSHATEDLDRPVGDSREHLGGIELGLRDLAIGVEVLIESPGGRQG